MHLIKSFCLFLSLHLSLQCFSQYAVIKGILDTSKIKTVSVSTYSPQNIPTIHSQSFSSKNGKFEFSILLEKPEIIEIVNNYFLLSPNDTLKLNIGDYLRSSITTSDSLNSKFLQMQKQYESFEANFWNKKQYTLMLQII